MDDGRYSSQSRHPPGNEAKFYDEQRPTSQLPYYSPYETTYETANPDSRTQQYADISNPEVFTFQHPQPQSSQDRGQYAQHDPGVFGNFADKDDAFAAWNQAPGRLETSLHSASESYDQRNRIQRSHHRSRSSNQYHGPKVPYQYQPPTTESGNAAGVGYPQTVGTSESSSTSGGSYFQLPARVSYPRSGAGHSSQPSNASTTCTSPLYAGSNEDFDTTGQICPPGGKPRLSTTLWEDEGTLCFQVETRGICVARREDNDMINGTKLLNVAGMSRGKRDGLLKNEKKRHVVKIGAMHLKGVWIPFERALEYANREHITGHLYPIFVQDIKSFLYHPTNYARTAAVMAAAQHRQQQQQQLLEQQPSYNTSHMGHPGDNAQSSMSDRPDLGSLLGPSWISSETSGESGHARPPFDRSVTYPNFSTTREAKDLNYSTEDRFQDLSEFDIVGGNNVAEGEQAEPSSRPIGGSLSSQKPAQSRFANRRLQRAATLNDNEMRHSPRRIHASIPELDLSNQPRYLRLEHPAALTPISAGLVPSVKSEDPASQHELRGSTSKGEHEGHEELGVPPYYSPQRSRQSSISNPSTPSYSRCSSAATARPEFATEPPDSTPIYDTLQSSFAQTPNSLTSWTPGLPESPAYMTPARKAHSMLKSDTNRDSRTTPYQSRSRRGNQNWIATPPHRNLYQLVGRQEGSGTGTHLESSITRTDEQDPTRSTPARMSPLHHHRHHNHQSPSAYSSPQMHHLRQASTENDISLGGQGLQSPLKRRRTVKEAQPKENEPDNGPDVNANLLESVPTFEGIGHNTRSHRHQQQEANFF